MTSCCPRRRMRWSGATGAIARGKNTSTGYARRGRSVHAWPWICGVKPKPRPSTNPRLTPSCTGWINPVSLLQSRFYAYFLARKQQQSCKQLLTRATQTGNLKVVKKGTDQRQTFTIKVGKREYYLDIFPPKTAHIHADR